MPQLMPIFTGASGINNRVDPVRLKYDPQTGIQELALGVNIDIDPSMRVSRRKGTTRVRTDVSHSLWSDGTVCYYVSGGSLYELNEGFTRTGLRSGLTTGARMSFVAAHGTTYYTNGFENGIIRNHVSSVWIGESYVGPDTIGHITTNPPVGHLLEIMSGHMLIASDSFIFFSWPNTFSWFRLATDFVPFNGRITMMKAVEDGLWVSDTTATYYLAGLDPSKWTRFGKAAYPATEGTACMVEGSKVLNGELQGMCAIWRSNEGVCIGGPQGFFRNLTERKLVLPLSSRGSGIVIDSRYICTSE